jgi:mono/diheme cytochrome c family protein
MTIIKLLIFTLVFLGASGPKAIQSLRTQQSHATKTQITKEEHDRLTAIGKKLFVERCSSCHGERGDKPLSSGAPLSERKLTIEEVAKSAGGRLKDATDEQRHAVTLYICSFIKKK